MTLYILRSAIQTRSEIVHFEVGFSTLSGTRHSYSEAIYNFRVHVLYMYVYLYVTDADTSRYGK